MKTPIATKISQWPGAANQQTTRMAYRSGCMTGSAIFCHFHSDTVRDTAGPVRPGQEKKCVCVTPLGIQFSSTARLNTTAHTDCHDVTSRIWRMVLLIFTKRLLLILQPFDWSAAFHLDLLQAFFQSCITVSCCVSGDLI